MANHPKDDKSLSRRTFIARTGKIAAAMTVTNLANLLAGPEASASSKKSAGKLAKKLTDGSTTNQSTVQRPTYKISRWFGDDFTVGHRMRNGDLPDLTKASGNTKVDFVIVGGGVAALVAAYKLKDESFVLLEQYDQVGGQSISRSASGLDYPLGAAYFVDNDGQAGQLVTELGLKPVAFNTDMDSYWLDKRWQRPADFAYKGLKDLKEVVSPLAASLNRQSIPELDSDLIKADATLFSAALGGLDGRFRQFLDTFLKSSTCATTDDVSLLAGADMTQELFGDRFVLPGGNGAISAALAAALQGRRQASSISKRTDGSQTDSRIKTNAFVWSIQIKDNGATVIYQHGKSGAAKDLHRIDCKHVIICTPPIVTGRILSNVSNQAKGNLFWMRYGSYFVSNFILDKPIASSSFDNFVSCEGVTDITFAQAPYQKAGTYNTSMGAVVTAYRPWSPGTEGRSLLLEGAREQMLAPVIKQLTELTGQSMQSLGVKEITVTRWGHAIAVPLPNYFGKLCKIYSANQNMSYSLAHSSLSGVQCLESAVQAGIEAAARAVRSKG